jgi:hypothetical protein
MARHLYVSWNMCNSQPSGLHELGRAALDADLYGIYVAQLRALGPATAWVVRAIDISSDCVLLSVVAHGMLCCCRRGSHREMGWVAPCAAQALALPGALLDSQLVQTWSRSSPLDCLKSVPGDAMSDAIDSADVMLYSVSLAYKESANVRLPAPSSNG